MQISEEQVKKVIKLAERISFKVLVDLYHKESIKEGGEFAKEIAAIMKSLTDDAEPVYRVLQSTQDGSFMVGGKPMWDKKPFIDPWLEKGRAREVFLYAHPPEADKLLQDLLDFHDGPSDVKRPDIFNKQMSAIRTYLEGKK